VAKRPESVEAFLEGKRLAVAGVSRDGVGIATHPDIAHRCKRCWLGRSGRAPV
jgi:hypothetical protein